MGDQGRRRGPKIAGRTRTTKTVYKESGNVPKTNKNFCGQKDPAPELPVKDLGESAMGQQEEIEVEHIWELAANEGRPLGYDEDVDRALLENCRSSFTATAILAMGSSMGNQEVVAREKCRSGLTATAISVTGSPLGNREDVDQPLLDRYKSSQKTVMMAAGGLWSRRKDCLDSLLTHNRKADSQSVPTEGESTTAEFLGAK